MKTLFKSLLNVITLAALAALVPSSAWSQTNRYVNQLPVTPEMQSNDTIIVEVFTNGAWATRQIPLLTVQGLSGWPSGGGQTNGFVDVRVTNGLATVPYVQLSTNGFVDPRITNGLAAIPFVTQSTNGFTDPRVTNGLSTIPYMQAQIQAATNGLTGGGTVPNGLVTNNAAATVTVTGAGVTSTLGTNAVTSPNVIANNITVSNTLTGPGTLALTNPGSTNTFAGQIVAGLLNSTNTTATNNLAGNVTIGGNLTAANVVPLQGGYVPYTNLNPVMFANWLQFTNAINGSTNAVAPANTSTVRAWVNFTNLTGGVFKLPLYQ